MNKLFQWLINLTDSWIDPCPDCGDKDFYCQCLKDCDESGKCDNCQSIHCDGCGFLER